MKKLPLLVFLSLFFFRNADAQEALQRNSLSLVVAPNWFNQFSTFSSDRHYDPGLGYSVGLDYTRKFNQHWHAGAVLRYNTWHSSLFTDGLVFEGDIKNGHPDPNAPRKKTIYYNDKAWQFMAGFGWHSKARKWRLNAGMEAGATSFTKKTTKSSVVTRLTLGANVGPEWCINRHFHLFLQPGGRVIFPKLGNAEIKGNRFLAFQLETGVRYGW
jgi:hypothetical protein